MYTEFLPLIAAAILAGISWSTVGVFSLYKNGLDSTINWLKVRKNVIIGTVLGIVGWGLGVVDKVGIPAINSPEAFIVAVAAYFPLVVLADKLFTKKEKPVEENSYDDSFDDDEG